MEKQSKIVKSSLNDVCPETGKRINRGDECLLIINDKRRVYHRDSNEYKQYVKSLKRHSLPFAGIVSKILF